MAETTRSTSGSSPQTTTTPGGARNASSPSSSATSPSPAATSTTASTTGAPSTARPGQSTATTNQAQRPQAQQQEQRSSAQGQQRQGQRQDEQAERRGEQSREERRDREEEHHIELSGNAMSDAKKVGSELVGAARESAISLLDAQRGRAADQIIAVGDALRRSVESLDAAGTGALAQYANQAADQICGFADTVRDRSWSELAGDIEHFARRYPITFMASAVGIGFIAGRFMLSSSERTQAHYRTGTSTTGMRTSDPRREVTGVGRTTAPGARAEYGSSGARE